MALLTCTAGVITPTEIIESVNIIQEQLITNNGFDRQNMATLGCVEFCPSVAAGITYGYKVVDDVVTFYEKTSQTNFAEGTVHATPLVDRTVVCFPGLGQTSFDVYTDSIKTEFTVLQSVQIPTDCTDGLHYFYYSKATGLLTQAQNPTEDLITDCAIACITYCNLGDGKMVLFGNEQHGIAMSGVTHKYLHENFGALYTSGLGINGIAAGTPSYTSIDSGHIADEDIDNYSNVQTVSPFWYKEGASGIWTADATANLDLALAATTYNYFNEWTGATWQLTEMANNSYILIHFFRTNDGKYPMVKILGEDNYNTIALAQAGATTEIANLVLEGLPTPEFVSCYTMIIDELGNLVLLEDGSEYKDWRTLNAVGTGGASAVTTLHADLTDTATEGHPTAAITYDTAVVFSGLLSNGTVTTDTQVDITASQYQEIVIDGPINLTFTSPAGPATGYLHIRQGATGGAVTFPPALWVDGAPLENTLTPNTGHDLLMVHYDGTQYVLGMMLDLK